MKSNLNKGKNNMRYEQKAELQDSNKARMYEEKKKQNEWIKLPKGSWIGLDYENKRNPLILWKDILKLKSDDDTIGYDFKVVGYRKVKVSDE